ncbi:membrane protein insertase YidC [Pseudactinotalea sp. Z1732]|uniref:membrane protein insertase YidC n=2 Tax=Micrococcales TaxID=85006 RepID=UPI003C7A808D
MSFFDNLLWPIKWVVAWIMVGAHDFLTWLGLDSAGGLTWALSIVALVIAIRILLIPLFVKQIKASRGMQILQPDMQKIQKKYKGKTDPASRQAMQQEMMALYREHGTTPFASCLPILAQMPIFFALFRVLWSMPVLAEGNYPRGDGTSIGGLTQELAVEFEAADFFGATLSSTFLHSEGLEPKIVSVILIIMMSLTMLFTQRQLTMKNMPASAQDNPMARQQRMLMYILPVVFAVTGVNFPIGVLIYWTTTNVWSLGQQWYVIRNNPTPGSEAYRKWEERKARKAEKKGQPLEDSEEEPEPEKPRGQRQQPVGKARAKKLGVRPGEVLAGEEDPDDAVSPAGKDAAGKDVAGKDAAGKDAQAPEADAKGSAPSNQDGSSTGQDSDQPGSAHHASAAAASGRKNHPGGKPGNSKKRKKRKQKKSRR